jgi:excisionase family DNA binding protein
MVAGMQTHTTPTTRTAPNGGGAGRLLTADDVADVLGVPRTFVYALARRGALPTVRVGERYVRFRTQALDLWIEQQETNRIAEHQ